MNYSKIYYSLHRLYSTVPYYTFLNGYAFPPLQILFELTYNCNLRCKMCQFLPIISNYDKEKESELTTHEVKSVIDQLPKLSLITFTGGEAFLRSDLFDILEYVKKKHKFHVITNGNFLTEEKSEKLVSMGCQNILSKGLIMMGISLEGNQDLHDKIVGQEGSFSKTIAGIKRLNDFKAKYNKKFPLINLAVVISKWNYPFISEMISIAEDNGIDILSFLTQNNAPLANKSAEFATLLNYKPKRHEYDMNVLNDQINTIVSRMKKTKVQIKFSPAQVPISKIIDQYDNDISLDEYKCFSFWSKLIITAQGNIFPCLPIYLGNVRDLSLRQIWNGEKARLFRKHIKNKGLFPSCVGCCMLEYSNNNL